MCNGRENFRNVLSYFSIIQIQKGALTILKTNDDKHYQQKRQCHAFLLCTRQFAFLPISMLTKVWDVEFTLKTRV